jgi:hypothetical protein
MSEVLPEPAVRVVGEGGPLLGGQPTAERLLDREDVMPAQELPREIAADRSHGHAMPARHDRGSLLERHEVPGSAVAVRDHDPAKARPCQRGPVVHYRVADNALANPDGADGVERERAEVQRGRQHRRPARTVRGDTLGEGLGEVARREGIHAYRQVGPVLFERAHREQDEGAMAIERVECRR